MAGTWERGGIVTGHPGGRCPPTTAPPALRRIACLLRLCTGRAVQAGALTLTTGFLRIWRLTSGIVCSVPSMPCSMDQLRASSASTSSVEALIHVDESDYSDDDWVLPFQQRGVVRIRTDEKFSDFYEIFGTIGEGKFGTVYRCRENSTGLELAAKRIAIKRDADRQNVEQEVAIMQKMRHPRIAQIYDAFATKKNDIILIMEVVEGGELFDRVADENYVLTELAVVMIVCQLCEAISYIHSHNIVHLDVKPENIMCVSQTGNRIKLIDFGLAQYYDGSKDLLLMAGTPEFAAPEVIKFEPLDFHTDMWSVGVITYILLSGISPFLGENNAETYNNVQKGQWEFDEESFSGISDRAKDFVSHLLVYDKDKRMSAKECLEHPWIVESRRMARQQSSIASLLDSPAIDTEKLRRYVHMRRWRKATLAIFAVQRMGWNCLSKRLRLAKCVTDQLIANREAVESAEKVLPLKSNQSLKKSTSLSPKPSAVGKAAASGADRKVPLKSRASAVEEPSAPAETKAKRLKVTAPSEAPAVKVDAPSATASPAIITAVASKSTAASKLTEEKKKEKSSAAQPPAAEPGKTIGKVGSLAKTLDTKDSPPAIPTDPPPSGGKIENVRRAFVFNSRALRDAFTRKIVQLTATDNAVATATTTEGQTKIRDKSTNKPSSQAETAQAAVTENTTKSKTAAKNTVTPSQPPQAADGAQQKESGAVKPVKATKKPTVKIEKSEEPILATPTAGSTAQTSRSGATLSTPLKEALSSGGSELSLPNSKPLAIKKKSTTAKTTELKLKTTEVTTTELKLKTTEAKTTELKLKTTEAKPDAATLAPAKRAKESENKIDAITKLRQPPANDSTVEQLPLMPLVTGLGAGGQRRKPSVANPNSAIVKLCAAALKDSQARECEKSSSDIDSGMSGDEQNKAPAGAACSSKPPAADAKPTLSSSKAAVASPGASAMDASSAGTKQMLAAPKAAVHSNSANAAVTSVPSTSLSKTAKASQQPHVNENNRPTTADPTPMDSSAKPTPSVSTSKSTTKRLIVPKVDANTDESSKQTGLPAGKQHIPAKNTDQTGYASTTTPVNVSGDKQMLVDVAKLEGNQPSSKKPAPKPAAEARKQERLTKEVANPLPTNSSAAPASSSSTTIPPSSPTKLLRQTENNTAAAISETQSSKSTTKKQEKSPADQQPLKLKEGKEGKEVKVKEVKEGKEVKVKEVKAVDDSSVTPKKAAVRTVAKTESAPTDTPSKKSKPTETAPSEPSTGLQNSADTPKAASASSSSTTKSVIKRKVQPSPKTASKSLSGETIVPKKIVCEEHAKGSEGTSAQILNGDVSNSKSATSTKEKASAEQAAALREKSEFEWAKTLLETRLKDDPKAVPEKKVVPKKPGDLTGNALRALQTWKNRDQQLASSKSAEPPRLAVSAI
uniref:Protein kinase domain-containing protein n=1 Tax=Plectus sambesii TaxID=2011161 RepID=A0A914WCY9_9BILA